MVEAAIVMPLLALLTFGAIELGIGFGQKGGIESATRAGARKAATLTDLADNPPANNAIGAETVAAVNAALGSSAIPELVRLYVYRSDVDPMAGCASNCIAFSPDGTGRLFDPASASGSWPRAQRDACKAVPDRVTVRLDGRFHFLAGLVGRGTIDLVAQTTLQLEPTNC